MRRLREFPSIAVWESAAVLDRSLAADRAGFDGRFDEASRAVFGVTEACTWEGMCVPRGHFGSAWSDELYDAEGLVAVFARHGWDVTDELGRELLVLRHFARQLLAAIKGQSGATIADREALSVDAWERRLAQDAAKVRRPAMCTAKTTPPLTEDERRRRNKAARAAKVWRPDPARPSQTARSAKV